MRKENMKEKIQYENSIYERQYRKKKYIRRDPGKTYMNEKNCTVN